jgi:Zn-dependent peptidase ImmA (M78 family)
VTLRRGFKSECNDIAREIRAELGLTLADPLDPWALADHLEIPVLPMCTLADVVPDAVRHFSRAANRGEFSAVTVFDGTKRVIMHNDNHSCGRQASNVSHELSHGLLLHDPKPALDGTGCRNWDPAVEEEAEWLSGALLISEEAALTIARKGISLDDAAHRFGVSRAMVQWRINVTGARKRVGRMRRRRPD